MKATVQDDTSIRGVGAAEVVSAPHGPVPVAPIPDPEMPLPAFSSGSRSRFVLGVFVDPCEANGAIASLAAGSNGACDLLLVSESHPRAAGLREPSVTVHRIDAAEGIAPKLRDALAQSAPFAPLWDSMSTQPDGGEMPGTPGMQRLFYHLVHCLAKGATLVIVRVPDPELQLLASRVLLEGKCEVLLTHEVLHSANRA